MHKQFTDEDLNGGAAPVVTHELLWSIGGALLLDRALQSASVDRWTLADHEGTIRDVVSNIGEQLEHPIDTHNAAVNYLTHPSEQQADAYRRQVMKGLPHGSLGNIPNSYYFELAENPRKAIVSQYGMNYATIDVIPVEAEDIAFQAGADAVMAAVTAPSLLKSVFTSAGNWLNRLTGALRSAPSSARAAEGAVGAGRTAAGEMDTIAVGQRMSTMRLTQPGETFLRYESGNPAFSRVTSGGGLSPGTFVAPSSEGLLPQSLLNGRYNLPSPGIPRVNVFEVAPPPNTWIIGPKPVMGGTGYEAIFPYGTGGGSVDPVIPVPR